MEAGKLRHHVRFERRIEEQDSDGALVLSWEPAFGGRLIPADVDDISGKELIAAAAVNGKTTTRIRLRYLPVNQSMRVLFQGQPYNIDAVIRDQDSRYQMITLNCHAGTNQG